LPGCPRGNSGLDKVGGLALLEGRSVGRARVASRVLRSSSETDSRGGAERVSPADGPVRRKRLRAIADDDLRERYGASPRWLEVGGLAQSATDGLVVVWSIGRGVAEVQPLTGGEAHWVRLSQLSPPHAG
jgi:hypothetical protein